MRIFKAIIMASLSIPALVFVLFSSVGLTWCFAMSLENGECDRGWQGVVYASAFCGYLALFVATVPTIVIGWPACVIANRLGHLSKHVILPGSALLGGAFLGVAGAASFSLVDVYAICWVMLAGAIGGLINGAVLAELLEI